MDIESVNDLMNNQDLLRNDLYSMLKNAPKTINELARDIGISRFTLHRFVLENRSIEMKTALMIKKYLEREK